MTSAWECYVQNLPTSRADLDGHDGAGTVLGLVSDEEVSGLIASVGRGIAGGAAATTAAVTTVVVTTGVVIYHSVEATKAELAANQADRDLAKAQDRLNQILVNKHDQQQQHQQQGQTQQQQTEPEAQTATGQRTGGGRNDQKSNQNRQQSAQDKLAQMKNELAALKSKPNKTAEEAARVKQLEKQVKHFQQKAAEKSENHSQQPKGQQ